MADWIEEGAAERSATQVVPVRHLLVQEHGGWSMWCSAGKGLPQTPVPGNRKFCRACVTLANEAIADGTLTPDDVQLWPVKAAA
jgi:hypothetical protein